MNFFQLSIENQVMSVSSLTYPKQSRDQSLQSTRMTEVASCPDSVQHYQQ